MFVEDAVLPANHKKIRCFGTKAALVVEATRLHAKGIEIKFTVNLEVEPNSGDQFNWTRKVTFQLSEHELPVLTSVFLGFLQKCEFTRSGKAILFERQPAKLFVSATQGAGNIFALPLLVGQAYLVCGLLLSQFEKNTNQSDGLLIVFALRGAITLAEPKF